MDCFAEPVIGRRFAPTRWHSNDDRERDRRQCPRSKAAEAKRAPTMSKPFRLLVVVMNDGLAAIAVLIFFLDHGRPVTWFVLLDDGGAIAIAVAVMIVGFADADAGSDGPYANTNLIRERW
jgi:hypothetical protein